METQVIPHNPEVEELILGTLMRLESALPELQPILTEDCFYLAKHIDIFKAICSIDERGESPDMLAVYQETQRLGSEVTPFEVSQIAGNVVHNYMQHALHLEELSIRRKLIMIGRQLEKGGYDHTQDITAVIQTAGERLDNLFSKSAEHVHDLKLVMGKVIERMNKNASGTGMTGSPTGFSMIDDRCGGLQGADLIVIAGETGSGKTALATTFVMHASKNGHKVAIYSMEMGEEYIGARMVAWESDVPANEIMFKKLSLEQYDKIDRAIGRLEHLPVYFDDRSTSSYNQIKNSIRSLVRKEGIRGFVIDYIQILNVNMPAENREAQMANIARDLKNLCKSENIWIILLSQVNRDRHAASKDRLRDSGQIGEAADILLYITRKKEADFYPPPFRHVSTRNTAMIELAKGRNIGSDESYIVGFTPSTTRYYDLDTPPKREEESDPDEAF